MYAFNLCEQNRLVPWENDCHTAECQCKWLLLLLVELHSLGAPGQGGFPSLDWSQQGQWNYLDSI